MYYPNMLLTPSTYVLSGVFLLIETTVLLSCSAFNSTGLFQLQILLCSSLWFLVRVIRLLLHPYHPF